MPLAGSASGKAGDASSRRPPTAAGSIFSPVLGCALSLSHIHGESGPPGTRAELRLRWVTSVPGQSRRRHQRWRGRMSSGVRGCNSGMGRGGQALAGIAAVTVFPVPRGERRMDGDTQGPVSHSRAHTRMGNLHLLGSDPMSGARPVRGLCHRLHSKPRRMGTTAGAPNSITRWRGCTACPQKPLSQGC